MLLRMALRSARRNMRRTLLTAGTVLVGTALLTVASAWIEGLIGGLLSTWVSVSGQVRVVDADFAAREQLQPLYENIVDADATLAAIRAVPGVTGAEPRIVTGVILSTTEEIGEDFGMLVGATESWYTERLHGPDHVLEGRWLGGEADEVVLGRKLAADVGAKVGDEILLLGQTQYGSMSPISGKIVGISGIDAQADHQAFVRLEDARWMVDLEGGALEILVWGEDMDPEALAPVVAALKADPALEGMAVLPWYGIEPWATSLPLMDGMDGFLRVLIGFVTVLAIFNTMTVSVLERTSEIGVLRAMGLSRSSAVWTFLIEAAIIGTLGGLAGMALGVAGGMYLQVVGVGFAEELVDRVSATMPMASRMYARVTVGGVLGAFTAGVVSAIVGAFIPALRAAAIQPVTAMRSRR